MRLATGDDLPDHGAHPILADAEAPRDLATPRFRQSTISCSRLTDLRHCPETSF